MDELDKKLLQLIQTEVPVAARPWADVAGQLGIGEAEVMQRITALKAGRAIRQISAIFDTKSLGYESSLVACQCDPAREDEVAAVISAHPGVSHNYKRDHEFNLWYTVAVAPNSRLGLQRTIETLHKETGAISTRPLPTLHLFKIGVELDVEGTGKAGDKKAGGYSHKHRKTDAAPVNIPFVREMQRDLPVESEPFVAIAGKLGISLEELQRIASEMKAAGQMRRFSAVLRHREIGFSANGMGVWAVPGDDAEILRVGEKMAAYRAVTHCYRRPSYPDWPFNIFTMIHARTKEECNAVVAEIAKETGIVVGGRGPESEPRQPAPGPPLFRLTSDRDFDPGGSNHPSRTPQQFRRVASITACGPPGFHWRHGGTPLWRLHRVLRAAGGGGTSQTDAVCVRSPRHWRLPDLSRPAPHLSRVRLRLATGGSANGRRMAARPPGGDARGLDRADIRPTTRLPVRTLAGGPGRSGRRCLGTLSHADSRHHPLIP